MGLVYLVRHASTEWNERQLWQGVVDTELSTTGIEQANGLAKYFIDNNIKIDFIFSSPMKRAFQTAHIIASKMGFQPDKILIDSRLRECEIVLWNGKNFEEIKRECFQEFLEWQNNLISSVNGVESLESVQKRMVEFFEEKMVHFANKNVIIVSHAISLRMFIAKILNLIPPNHLNYSLDNASISAVEQTKDRLRIKFLNLTICRNGC
ncbi:MAG: histidine phosphatase family protein [Fervidobacterium sp.]|nr:histidine phosphatase family protein [Fervidobacterium sp.]